MRLRSVMRHHLLDHGMIRSFIDDITTFLKMISMLFVDNTRFVDDYRLDLMLKLLHLYGTSSIIYNVRGVHWTTLMRMTYIMDDLLMVTVR